MRRFRVNNLNATPTSVNDRTYQGAFCAVAIGPAALHTQVEVVIDGGVAYRLGVGELLPVSGKRLQVNNVLDQDDSDLAGRYRLSSGSMANIVAGANGGGDGGLLTDNCEIELYLFESVQEAMMAAPALGQRRPYLFRDVRTNWTTSSAEQYHLPVLGRRFVSIKMQSTTGTNTVSILGRSHGTNQSGQITLESGIAVTTTAVGRVIEVEDFDLLVIQGVHGSETGTAINFRLWGTIGGHAEGGRA